MYLAERVFWVPKEARWKNLQDNLNLKGMLPGNYGRATLDKRRLGDRVGSILLRAAGPARSDYGEYPDLITMVRVLKPVKRL